MSDQPAPFDPATVPDGMILTTAGEVRRLGLYWRPSAGPDITKRLAANLLNRDSPNDAPVLAYLPESVMVIIPIDVARGALDAMASYNPNRPAIEDAIAEAVANR